MNVNYNTYHSFIAGKMKRLRRITPACLWFHISIRLYRIKKWISRFHRIAIPHQRTIVFIVGCQRSGTSLLLRIFERDVNTKVYGEFSKLFSQDMQHNIRLNPLSSAQAIFDKERAPLIVLKPLVETQNSVKLLNHFESSKALWLYRHYKDVASSYITRFGVNTELTLKPIVENSPGNWRSEHISDPIREIVLQHFSEDMNPYDAAALFWFVRNSFFFDLKLAENPDVMLIRYEDFVMNPLKNMKNIYAFIDHNFPGDAILTGIDSASVGKGRNIPLSSEIDILCETLLKKLDNSYQIKISD